MAATGQKADATGRNRRTDAEARKAQALPLVVAGQPYGAIGKAVGVSARTVRRWVEEDPDFAAGVERAKSEAQAQVGDVTERIADITRASLEALSELVRSEDERVRLDATKTALDRFGHPVMAKSEQAVEHKGGGVVVVMSEDEMRRAARGGR